MQTKSMSRFPIVAQSQMINSGVSLVHSASSAFPVSRAMNPTQIKLQKRLAEGVMSVSSHAAAKHRSTAGQGFNETTSVSGASNTAGIGGKAGVV